MAAKKKATWRCTAGHRNEMPVVVGSFKPLVCWTCLVTPKVGA